MDHEVCLYYVVLTIKLCNANNIGSQVQCNSIKTNKDTENVLILFIPLEPTYMMMKESTNYSLLLVIYKELKNLVMEYISC